MKQRDLDTILNWVCGKSFRIPGDFDWYAACGFLEFHKLAGYLANRLPEGVPPQVRKYFASKLAAQRKRNAGLALWTERIGREFDLAGIEFAFLKGSVLSGSELGGRKIYAEGERTSNDIDVLIRSKDISAAGEVLKAAGFVQGSWNPEREEIEPLSRLEVLSRRMNRGETAPFLKKTAGEPLCVEIDLNFSLGFLPNGDEELVDEMLRDRQAYRGAGSVWGLSPEWNFLQLLLHQYKECALYSMIVRNKAYLLYKLLDILLLLRGNCFDFGKFAMCAAKYNAQTECCAVLGQVERLFDCGEAARLRRRLGAIGNETVADPPTGREFRWTRELSARVAAFDCARFLEECR